ncbi:hypothetical protein QBC40DRAFT_283520 [Triangularia verruculosa]|uniref:Uncharacterized protein n=1 Tax=Triangularia verruculosa TaxID=2587418 RepID=A0AAN6XFL9_9PEZI|nr:hypothetical protein QBC40DRAFT_283520 [Triangularia verruculosa]
MAPISYQLNTLLPTLTTNLLTPRQDNNNPPTVTVITGTNTNPPDDRDPDDASTLTGGAIAGIVIGSIAGLLLLIWIIRSCTNLGAPPNKPEKPWYGSVRDEYPPRHASRSRSRHSGRHARTRTVSRERTVGMTEVRGVEPVYVRRESRSRSRGRGVDGGGGYAVYGREEVRGGRRSRSRGY